MSSMSLNMSELIMSGLNKMIGDIVCEVVMKCGEAYNFDSSEMMRSMNLCDMRVSLSSKSKAVKSKVVKEAKSKLPMPFNGIKRENCCVALRQNHGLYTQCETIVSEGDFCKKCGPSANYGTISDRLAVGIMEYRDPKGKAPTPFVKVMKKLKISRDEVEVEANKLNIVINDIHFEEEVEVEKKEKGRPKKPRRKIELADDSTDLFAALVAKANEDSEEDEVSDLSCDEKLSIAESIVDSVLDKVSVISENNEKKAEKEAAKLAEKAEKEAAKLAEKAEKEAAKLAEKEAAKLALIQKKEAEKAEKEATKLAEIQKKEAEKAEKEAAKLAEIQKKEAEKEAAKLALIQKKEAEKAEKEASKQKKESVKPVAKAVKASSEPVAKAVKSSAKSVKASSDPVTEKAVKSAKKVEEEEEADVVKRFEFEGVKYLKSKNTGIIYNMDQDVVGKWNEKTGKIDFEEAGSEEEEEEYDE